MRISFGFVLAVLLSFPHIINAKTVGKSGVKYDFFPTNYVAGYLEKSNQPTYFKKGINNQELTNAECLSFALYSEARGEQDEGIVAVAFVIRNRSYGNDITICEVVREKDQFVPNIKKLYSQYDKDAWLYCLIIASNLVDNRQFETMPSPVGDALYFNSLSASEQGIMGKGRLVRKIGHHYFYK